MNGCSFSSSSYKIYRQDGRHQSYSPSVLHLSCRIIIKFISIDSIAAEDEDLKVLPSIDSPSIKATMNTIVRLDIYSRILLRLLFFHMYIERIQVYPSVECRQANQAHLKQLNNSKGGTYGISPQTQQT